MYQQHIPQLSPSHPKSFLPTTATMFATHTATTFSPATTGMPAARALYPPQGNALVLNWEDVLAPTSLLAQRIGLQPSRQAMHTARDLLIQDVYLQQALASIEEQTITLIMKAALLGPVVIVTEKSLKYMEVTCGVFFPRLAAFLLQANMPGAFAQQQQQPHLHRIRVVAAPRKFSSTMEQDAWRVSIFQSVYVHQLQKLDQAGHNVAAFSLISVSASDRDSMACVSVVESAAATTRAGVVAIPKCMQVSQAQSLEEFFAQLQTLQQYIGTAAKHGSAFATRL